MATVKEKMTAIADAIREKTGEDNALTLDDMAGNISKVFEKGKEDGFNSGYGTGHADGLTEGYNNGYEQGAIDNTPSVDPNWTDWRYMFYYGTRSDLLNKLEFTDTANGTDFESTFAYHPASSLPVIDTSKGTNFRQTFRSSQITSAPELDYQNALSMSAMFMQCKSLHIVPPMNCGKVTTFQQMFQDCQYTYQIGDMDTSSGEIFSYMFNSCGKYASFTKAPIIDTSNGTTFLSMFDGCARLQTIPRLNLSKSSAFTNMFRGCSALTNIGIEGTISASLSLSDSPLLSECAKNILKALVSYVGTTNVNKYTITFKSTVKNALIAEGATAPDGLTWDEYVTTVKGWNW